MFRALETKIYRWLKARRDRRVMRGQAKLVLTSDDSSPMAKAWAASVVNAIKSRKDICKHCLRPFDPWEMTTGERFHLRAILGIADRELDPKICRTCFDTAISTYNPRQTMPGTSNFGPPNLALIDKYTHGSKNHG